MQKRKVKIPNLEHTQPKIHGMNKLEKKTCVLSNWFELKFRDVLKMKEESQYSPIM